MDTYQIISHGLTQAAHNAGSTPLAVCSLYAPAIVLILGAILYACGERIQRAILGPVVGPDAYLDDSDCADVWATLSRGADRTACHSGHVHLSTDKAATCDITHRSRHACPMDHVHASRKQADACGALYRRAATVHHVSCETRDMQWRRSYTILRWGRERKSYCYWRGTSRR